MELFHGATSGRWFPHSSWDALEVESLTGCCGFVWVFVWRGVVGGHLHCEGAFGLWVGGFGVCVGFGPNPLKIPM